MLRFSLLFDRCTGFTSTLGLVLACLAVVGATCHILIEIVLRGAFSSSTFVLDEFVSYSIVCITFLAAAATFRNNAHVRVRLFLEKVGAAGKLLLDAVCHFILVYILSVAIFYTYLSTARDLERGTVSATIAAFPIWIVKAAMLVGLILLLLEVINSTLAILVRREVKSSSMSAEI